MTTPQPHPEPSDLLAQSQPSTVGQPTWLDRVRSGNSRFQHPEVHLPQADISVKYRRRTFDDLLNAGQLPNALTELVRKAITTSDAFESGDIDGLNELDTGKLLKDALSGDGVDPIALITDLNRVRDSYCVSGAIEPQLVWHEHLVTDPNRQLWYLELSEDDRKVLAAAILGEEQKTPVELAPFPGEIVPVVHVPAVPVERAETV